MKEEQFGFLVDIECDLEDLLNDSVEGGNVVQVDVPGVEDLGLGLLLPGEELRELVLRSGGGDAGGGEEVRIRGESRHH